jgi:proline dehydrogenase
LPIKIIGYLTRDYGIFSLMSFNKLVNTGISIASFMVKTGLSFPVVLGIRPTVFPLFCAGESLKSSIPKINMLYKYGIESILDYGVEEKKVMKIMTELLKRFKMRLFLPLRMKE